MIGLTGQTPPKGLARGARGQQRVRWDEEVMEKIGKKRYVVDLTSTAMLIDVRLVSPFPLALPLI